MYYEPDRVILGGTPSTHRSIQWTGDAFGSDVDGIDPSNLTYDWTIDTTATQWKLIDGDEGGTNILTATSAETTVHTDLTVAGGLLDVNIADDTVRLSSFDTNGRLELRHSSTDSDQIGFIDRVGTNDYDLRLLQGGAEERVFTTADDGSFDAATLGGDPPSAYAATGNNETVTGNWAFDAYTSYTSDFELLYDPDGDGNDAGLQFGVSSNRAYIAPYDYGAAAFDNTAEITYDVDGNAEWNIEGAPLAGGDAIATEPWVTGELVDVSNSGTLTLASAAEISFGSDLDTTDNGDGSVTVDFVGGGTSDDIYEDGTQIVADAAYLDFINHFNVTEGANGEGQVEVDTTSEIADLTAAETVSGAWAFSPGLSAGGTVDVDDSAGHLELLGGGTGATDTADPYIVDKSGDSFRVQYNDVSAGTTTTLISGAAGGSVDFPSGTLSEQGNAVATETWVQNTAKAADADLLDGNNSTYYAALSENESVTGAWTFDTGPTFAAGLTVGTDYSVDFGGEWNMYRGSTNGTLYVEETTDANTAIARFTDTGAEFPEGATVGGNAAATEYWVKNTAKAADADLLDGNDSAYFAALSEAETVTGGWAFDDNATYGLDPAETITETTSPKSYTYSATTERDIHRSTDVTISNSSGGNATEDITVELYDGVDTTGTLLLSETQSISLADASSTTANFIATDEPLDTGDYHIEVTQSGTALTIDESVEYTRGATYTHGQKATGDYHVQTQYGTDAITVDPISNAVDAANGSLSEQGNRVATRNWSLNNHPTFSENETITGSWDFTSTITIDKYTLSGQAYALSDDLPANRNIWEAAFGEATNAYRGKNIVNIEYHDGTGWVSWSPGDFDNIVDGDLDSNTTSVDETHSRFRFTLDAGAWNREYGLSLIKQYGSGGYNAHYDVTYESSNDQSAWTERFSETGFQGGYQDAFTGLLEHGDSYHRWTFDVNLGTSETFDIVEMAMWSNDTSTNPDPLQYSGDTVTTSSNLDVGTSISTGGAITSGGAVTASTDVNVGGTVRSDGNVANGASFVYADAANNDADIWHIGNGPDYSFQMQYYGSGTGDDNRLELYTSDQTTGTHTTKVWDIWQSGNVDFKQKLTQKGNDVVTASSADYVIQKNGTDGTGIINFKT